jgi:uncharacterized protein
MSEPSHSTNTDEQILVRSPCISNCCLDQQDICMGCFRHIDEITGWHSADTARRKQILENTAKRRSEKLRPT